MRFNIVIQLLILLIAPLSAIAVCQSLNDCYDAMVDLKDHWSEVSSQYGVHCQWPRMYLTTGDVYSHFKSLRPNKEPPATSIDKNNKVNHKRLEIRLDSIISILRIFRTGDSGTQLPPEVVADMGEQVSSIWDAYTIDLEQCES
ncbi:hypothetical protein FRC03_000532 [Tulasnella sp. 419]|nr:hypothetical protein FRC03_000532 [Tulasnella sp. 419]